MGRKYDIMFFYLPNLDKPNQKGRTQITQIPQIFANKG